MSQTGQVIAWFAFFGLVVVARLLITRPAQRVLGPHVRRLVDWGWEYLNRPEEVDPEVEELMIIRRRQQLETHIERLRRILRDDVGDAPGRESARVRLAPARAGTHSAPFPAHGADPIRDPGQLRLAAHVERRDPRGRWVALS